MVLPAGSLVPLTPLGSFVAVSGAPPAVVAGLVEGEAVVVLGSRVVRFVGFLGILL